MDEVQVFKALSDATRLRIIVALSRGSFNVQELTSILRVSQSTVSHHLKILVNASIVESKKDGTWAYYRLTDGDENAFQRGLLELFLGEAVSNGKNGWQDDDTAIESVLRLRSEQSRRYFESVASSWSSIRQEIPGASYPLGLLFNEIDDNGVLLDLGCGTGALLEHILPRKGKTLAVDYSEAMLQEARESLGSKTKDVDFRLGYLEHLPLGDHTVDIAVGFMVFHHVAEPLFALKDIYRVLRPGGKIVIGDLLTHDKEFMREQFADTWLGFKQSEFTRWLKRAGFSTVEKIKLPEHHHDVFLLTANKQEEIQ